MKTIRSVEYFYKKASGKTMSRSEIIIQAGDKIFDKELVELAEKHMSLDNHKIASLMISSGYSRSIKRALKNMDLFDAVACEKVLKMSGLYSYHKEVVNQYISEHIYLNKIGFFRQSEIVKIASGFDWDPPGANPMWQITEKPRVEVQVSAPVELDDEESEEDYFDYGSDSTETIYDEFGNEDSEGDSFDGEEVGSGTELSTNTESGKGFWDSLTGGFSRFVSKFFEGGKLKSVLKNAKPIVTKDKEYFYYRRINKKTLDYSLYDELPIFKARIVNALYGTNPPDDIVVSTFVGITADLEEGIHFGNPIGEISAKMSKYVASRTDIPNLADEYNKRRYHYDIMARDEGYLSSLGAMINCHTDNAYGAEDIVSEVESDSSDQNTGSGSKEAEALVGYDKFVFDIMVEHLQDPENMQKARDRFFDAIDRVSKADQNEKSVAMILLNLIDNTEDLFNKTNYDGRKKHLASAADTVFNHAVFAGALSYFKDKENPHSLMMINIAFSEKAVSAEALSKTVFDLNRLYVDEQMNNIVVVDANLNAGSTPQPQPQPQPQPKPVVNNSRTPFGANTNVAGNPIFGTNPYSESAGDKSKQQNTDSPNRPQPQPQPAAVENDSNSSDEPNSSANDSEEAVEYKENLMEIMLDDIVPIMTQSKLPVLKRNAVDTRVEDVLSQTFLFRSIITPGTEDYESIVNKIKSGESKRWLSTIKEIFRSIVSGNISADLQDISEIINKYHKKISEGSPKNLQPAENIGNIEFGQFGSTFGKHFDGMGFILDSHEIFIPKISDVEEQYKEPMMKAFGSLKEARDAASDNKTIKDAIEEISIILFSSIKTFLPVRQNSGGVDANSDKKGTIKRRLESLAVKALSNDNSDLATKLSTASSSAVNLLDYLEKNVPQLTTVESRNSRTLENFDDKIIRITEAARSGVEKKLTSESSELSLSDFGDLVGSVTEDDISHLKDTQKDLDSLFEHMRDKEFEADEADSDNVDKIEEEIREIKIKIGNKNKSKKEKLDEIVSKMNIYTYTDLGQAESREDIDNIDKSIEAIIAKINNTFSESPVSSESENIKVTEGFDFSIERSAQMDISSFVRTQENPFLKEKNKTPGFVGTVDNLAVKGALESYYKDHYKNIKNLAKTLGKLPKASTIEDQCLLLADNKGAGSEYLEKVRLLIRVKEILPAMMSSGFDNQEVVSYFNNILSSLSSLSDLGHFYNKYSLFRITGDRKSDKSAERAQMYEKIKNSMIWTVNNLLAKRLSDEEAETLVTKINELSPVFTEPQTQQEMPFGGSSPKGPSQSSNDTLRNKLNFK